MKILVTGVAGFIGCWVSRWLVDAGHRIYGVDNLSGGDEDNVAFSGSVFSLLDLRDGDAVANYMATVKPEVVYHLAASAREGASQFQPKYITETNLMAFMNLIEPAVKAGLKKLVFTSSMAVYGDQTPPFDETVPPRPVDVYGINKTAIEKSLEVLADVHEFDYTIIRPHNVFGERQCLKDKYRNVIGIWMNCILRGEPAWIFGDGEQIRAFSYILDSIPCYVRCLTEANGETINIGGAKPYSINDAWRLVQEAMGVSNYPVKYLPSRPREVKYAFCTSDKSERLLGYQEKIGFEEGVRRMAKWAKIVGPVDWTTEKLPLSNKKTPVVWL